MTQMEMVGLVLILLALFILPSSVGMTTGYPDWIYKALGQTSLTPEVQVQQKLLDAGIVPNMSKPAISYEIASTCARNYSSYMPTGPNAGDFAWTDLLNQTHLAYLINGYLVSGELPKYYWINGSAVPVQLPFARQNPNPSIFNSKAPSDPTTVHMIDLSQVDPTGRVPFKAY